MNVANIKLKYNQSQHCIDSEDNAFLHTHLKIAYVCSNMSVTSLHAELRALPFKMYREQNKTLVIKFSFLQN